MLIWTSDYSFDGRSGVNEKHLYAVDAGVRYIHAVI